MTALLGILNSIGVAIWGYLAAGIAAVVLLVSVWSKGRKSVRTEVEAETASANRRMLDAAMRAPQEKDDVVKDLRGGRF